MRVPLILPVLALGLVGAFALPSRGDWWIWCVAWLGTASVASLAFFIRNKILFQSFTLLSVLILGLTYSLWRTDLALSQQWQAELYPHSVPLTIEVTGLPEIDEEGNTQFIALATTQEGQTYRLRLRDYTERVWHAGSRWRIQARVRAPIGAVNPMGFDTQAWALSNGIDGVASVGKERTPLPTDNWFWSLNRWREWIADGWRTAGQNYPQGAGLMQALAVGYRSGLSREAWASFRPLGLNHLISISGLHISMVAVLVTALAKLVMRHLPVIPKRPRVWQLGLGWVSAVIYTGLAGWEIPALRSLIMLSVFAGTWVIRGYLGSWQVWWLAVVAVLLYQPMATLSAGFWLSFGLVGALLWVGVWWTPQNKWILAIRAQWSATLLGSISAVYFFGVLPIFSPVVNAVAIPLFTAILVPLALLGSVIPLDGFKSMIAWIGEYTVQVLLYLGAKLPELALPHAPYLMLIMAIVASLIILLPRGLRLRPFALLALAMFTLYRPAKIDSQLKITVFDVGQGLSVLLQTPHHNVLFDTGTPAAELGLLPNLRALGVRQLHHLILSHHDDDHDGGYPLVQKEIKIKKLWAGQAQYYPKAEYCQGDKTFELDGLQFEFLTPPPRADAKDNDLSCVLRVVSDQHSIIITGDLGWAGEKALIEKYGQDLYSQLLVLGHHGSHSSNSLEFLQTVAPEIAIASSGFANHFKHPHPKVMERLQSTHTQLVRTDTQGTLIFEWNKQGIKFSPLNKKWWQLKPFSEDKFQLKT